MKFVCDRCQTKYSIADERVRGKILKVKCKSCANVITVREARRPSAGYAPLSATGHDSERTVLAPNPGMLAEAMMTAPPAPARQTGAHPIPTAPPVDDGLAWYMALSGERSGPFSRKQLVDKLIVLPKNADLHVWNEALGAWKPPFDVPAVANDLLTRRKAPPPLPPGAPRRGTPSPPPPVGAQAHAAKPAGRPTGSMPAVGSPLHPGGGLKLPPPSGGGHSRPLAALAAGAAAAHAPESGVDIDPSSMLETPAPQPHMLHGHGGTNGVGHARKTGSHAATSAATRSSSDVLKLLNLPGAAESTPGAPPRLISATDAVGWSPSVGAPAARSRTATLILAFIGMVAVICMVVLFGLSKKKKDPMPLAAPKAAVTDPLAGVVEKMNAPLPTPPPPIIAPVPDPPAPPPTPIGRGKLGKGKGGKGRGTMPVALATTGAPAAPPVDNSAAARYRDTGGGIKVTPTAANPNRPPPSQGEISAVIKNNQGGIKNCYQRALLRDSSLTHGKITVKLTLGISGRVKHAAIDGPQQFRAVEPCIKELVTHWVFPQASDEYGTEFVYVFQGNE
jgi:predicted Zn finger-like uncharacterized protein